MTAPRLAEQVRGKGRMYRDVRTGDGLDAALNLDRPWDGTYVPSITNIIGVRDKPAIPRWSANMVAEYVVEKRANARDILRDAEEWAHERWTTDKRKSRPPLLRGWDAAHAYLKSVPWERRDRAAARGTEVHEVLELAGQGVDLFDDEVSDDARPFLPAARAFLAEWVDEFLWTEATVFGDGYAGTGDFHYARLGHGPHVPDKLRGAIVTGDYKTNDRLLDDSVPKNKRASLYPEIALQLAALRFADVLVDQRERRLRPVPPVEAAIGVLITPQGYLVSEVKADGHAHRTFLACRDVWHWNKTKPLGTSRIRLMENA